MDPVRYNGWPKGVDNLHADFDVPEGALRDAVNVDILTSGRVRRRRGLTQAIASAGAHSLFSDGLRMVWGTANELKLADANLAVATLLTDARLAKPISFVELNGEIYWSNEDVNGKITAANVYEPWGITPPSAAPLLSAQSGARYVMVTCTFVLASGEESGAPLAARVACTDTPVIEVSAIPQSSDARVVATRLYVTGLNGTEFFAEVDVPAGTTTYTLTGSFGTGQQLRTQFMEPPPAGQLIEEHGGRIYIASGANVYRTQPLRYGLHDPHEDYFMFPERVTLLKGVDAGLFVSAERTFLLANPGTGELAKRDLLPYRAIERAACDLPDSEDVLWLSERGFVRGSNDGQAVNLNEGAFAPDLVESACMGLIEFQGDRRAVAIATEGERNPLTSDYFEAARIERNAELA